MHLALDEYIYYLNAAFSDVEFITILQRATCVYILSYCVYFCALIKSV